MTDVWGRTPVEGLYACGESACVSVHGANRLGGNSLLETIVFGRRAGRSAVEYVTSTRFRPFPDRALAEAAHEIAIIMNRTEGELFSPIREEAKATMEAHCGIFRDEERLKTGLEKIRALRERYEKGVFLSSRQDSYNTELINILELGNILELAEVILLSALNRRESRGAHYRRDYPHRDDKNWLKHTLVTIKDGSYTIGYKPVVITRFKPAERRY